MTKTGYRQFIDEVYFLGKQKEYSGIFNKIIPSLKLNTFKKAKKILLDKRKAYDFSLANLFRKYAMDNNDLYDELDKLWESIDELEELKKYEFLGVPIAMVPTVGLPIAGTASIALKITRLQLIFNSYIDKTREYCNKVAKEQIDEQE
ncbi:hypothetical protein [Clostridium sp.]|uniref:hypothetical protein n=1 Tax=Clostridium sp. TaxID=1506 RepID=UPI00283F16BA|nr:hypothetical protein [Clostridium sp.]MDR3595064.1 hypothetical protein [Clostridium sp.]